MNETTIAIITFLISAAIFIPVGIIIRKKSAESKIKSAEVKQIEFYQMLEKKQKTQKKRKF